MGRTEVSQCLTVYKKLQPNEDAELDVWVRKRGAVLAGMGQNGFN